MRRILLFILLITPYLSYAGPSPDEVVNEYSNLWRNRSIAIGVEKCWSVESTLKYIFNDDYIKLSVGDKAYLKRLFEIHVIIPNTFENIAADISKSTFNKPRIIFFDNNICVVAVDITTEDGEVLKNKIKLEQINGAWKIVDTGVLDKDYISEILNNMWLKVRNKIKPTTMFELLVSQSLSLKTKDIK